MLQGISVMLAAGALSAAPADQPADLIAALQPHCGHTYRAIGVDPVLYPGPHRPHGEMQVTVHGCSEARILLALYADAQAGVTLRMDRRRDGNAVLRFGSMMSAERARTGFTAEAGAWGPGYAVFHEDPDARPQPPLLEADLDADGLHLSFRPSEPTVLVKLAEEIESNPPPSLFDALSVHCGQAFEGSVTSDDPRDESFASQRLVMHVRDCEDDVLRIPFHVGEDRSRVWVFTRQSDDGIELKHNHRHEDGEQDVLSWYGGRTIGTAFGPSQAFPADAFSQALFEAEGIPDSMQNTWFVTVTDTQYVYELQRPNRHFRAVFDLTQPVETPPPAWGDEEL